MTETFRCPFCSHENPSGARFCNECGSPLHLAPCTHCDAVNDIELSACHGCGAPLPRVPHAGEIPTIEAPAAESADEPSHTISSDIDTDALDAAPPRDTRRRVLPVALAAIALLAVAGTVVGYAALREGKAPDSTGAERAQAPAVGVAASASPGATVASSVDTTVITSPGSAAISSATPDWPAPAPAPATAGTGAAPPSPRPAPIGKAEPAADKDAAATQRLIRREIDSFAPPKQPPPPRAPPAPR